MTADSDLTPPVSHLTLPADPKASAADTASVTFIGTATVLLRLGAFTVLTDPNFLHAGDRAYLGKGLWSKRTTNPAMEIAELPAYDVVVLSHLHDDHMDRIARAELPKAPPVVTTRHGARELRKDGFTTFGLRTWETQAVTKGGDATLRITSMPGVHSTNPVLKAALPPVMGSMIELESSPGVVSRRVYITGDTMPHLDLRQIATRYPDIDLALLHLGGTRILGMTVTMTGEHGAKLARLLAPAQAAAIHYDDYPVFKSPLSDFRAAVERIGLPTTEVVHLSRGETHSFG